ncbi:AfsR/SARP family transcriptional regulator [Micromonospora auratinigra]|uniref:DNA-binding transcriptional activator of the SARP family n=1 Tax=Micromonospora auratinigra TaxID=261654 RepID=A0A1A8ZVY3_9ACTN|nr:AfsR/SARP family transcriptional regulator [Micromonospora auratinigra]SBT48081.1 DNA-binding transcriptional activator of the SARP family [Micromonospora auratinigra]
MSEALRFEILGPQRAWLGDRALDLGPSKQRAVLAVLLLSAGRPVPTAQIVEAVWPEDPPANGPNVVQKHVAGLRRVLEPERSPRTPGRLLALTDAGYVLRVDPTAVDAVRFEQGVRRAERARAEGRTADAVAELKAALELWHGEPFGGFSGALLEAARHRLTETRATALETRAELELELGRHRELVGELVRLVAEYPLRERLRQQLMLALHRSDRQAEALAAYREFAGLLRDEFGIEPGEVLQDLHRRMLRADPTLTPATAASVVPSPAPPPTAGNPPGYAAEAPGPDPSGPDPAAVGAPTDPRSGSPDPAPAPAPAPAEPRDGPPEPAPAPAEPRDGLPVPAIGPPVAGSSADGSSAVGPAAPVEAWPAPAGRTDDLATRSPAPAPGMPAGPGLGPVAPPFPSTPPPALPGPPPVRRPRPAPRWVSITATVLGALIVLLSFGCFTWLVVLGYAAWRRSWRLALAGAGYLVCATVVSWLLLRGDPEAESPDWEVLLFVGLTGICWLAGAVHVVLLSRRLWAMLTGRTDDRAAEERRVLREQARYLLHQFPAARYELAIGRPDVPHRFDDGGLVDVNAVGDQVLATLAGLDAGQRRQLAMDRWLRGPYRSMEELAGRCMFPPAVTEALRDVLLFLPPPPTLSLPSGTPPGPTESAPAADPS